MRKTVQIMGVGSRKTGISKRTQKPYDFTEISIGYDSPDFFGQRCETVAVDASLLNGVALAPGEVIDIVCHEYNFKLVIDAIL